MISKLVSRWLTEKDSRQRKRRPLGFNRLRPYSSVMSPCLHVSMSPCLHVSRLLSSFTGAFREKIVSHVNFSKTSAKRGRMFTADTTCMLPNVSRQLCMPYRNWAHANSGTNFASASKRRSGSRGGEMGWIFTPLFLSPLLSFFHIPQIFNQAFILLHYYKNSPPISKSWIGAWSEHSHHVWE